jgi:hypothetical protein
MTDDDNGGTRDQPDLRVNVGTHAHCLLVHGMALGITAARHDSRENDVAIGEQPASKQREVSKAQLDRLLGYHGG